MEQSANIDVVDTMMALDLIGEPCNISENRKWLFDHMFHEVFTLEDGDYAKMSWSVGFTRDIWITEEYGICVWVKFLEDGMCEATVPLNDFSGRMVHLLRGSDYWYKALSMAERTGISNAFRSNSAEEAVYKAVIAGRDMVVELVDLFHEAFGK